ncbi:hypothetical protein CEXT_253911 [Caerostris extrusa]|uniref:Uncharacterized protein n=1 Tax=Caerostris extrusa TaxID=172846 RepID=A0AAV4XAS7_CAEEX|nr:hypothetical protein CEXT_253911 [Caerostris extrusa]
MGHLGDPPILEWHIEIPYISLKLTPINLYFWDGMEHDLLQISPFAYRRSIGTDKSQWVNCENPSSPSPRAAYMDPLYIPKIHPH